MDEFTSLVNPQSPIPYFITGLTGIDDQMVQNAPVFHEIADTIQSITEGCILWPTPSILIMVSSKKSLGKLELILREKTLYGALITSTNTRFTFLQFGKIVFCSSNSIGGPSPS